MDRRRAYYWATAVNAYAAPTIIVVVCCCACAVGRPDRSLAKVVSTSALVTSRAGLRHRVGRRSMNQRYAVDSWPLAAQLA